MSFQPRDAVVLVVPGVLTGGLALLYGAGAITKSGQIRDAGLNVRDTLPLVPLEQVLALGIGVLVTSLLSLLLFGFIAFIYVGLWPMLSAPPSSDAQSAPEALEESATAEEPSPVGEEGSLPVESRPESTPVKTKGGRRFRLPRKLRFWASLGLVVFTVGLYFSTKPFLTAVGFVAGFLLVYAVDLVVHRGRRYIFYVVLAYFLLTVTANTAAAYVTPRPLPEVSLRVRGQPGLTRGTLIVGTGDAWYITNRSKTYRAVPRSSVMSAVVHSRERSREPRPVPRAFWDWITSR